MLLWVPGFLGMEPKKGSGFLGTRTQKSVPGSWEWNPKRVPGSWEREPKKGFQERGTLLQIAENKNSASVPRSWEPFLGSRSQECGTLFGFSFSGTRNHFWVPFPGTREPIVTWLEMEGKIYLNTPTCSKTHRNEMSSAFRVPGNGTHTGFRVPGNGTRNWHP